MVWHYYEHYDLIPLSNQVSGYHKGGEIIKDKRLTQQLKILSFNLKHIQLLTWTSVLIVVINKYLYMHIYLCVCVCTLYVYNIST